MKGFARLIFVVVAATAFVVSCSKDKPTGSLVFDTPAVFVKAGEKIVVDFKASNNISATSYVVTSKPKGWDEPKVDAAAHTVTIQIPEESKFGDDVVRKGSIVLTAAPKGGSVASASLFVSVADEIDLNEGGVVANSYLVSKKESSYTFDAKHKGDMTEVVPEKIEILWQSQAGLLQYVTLKDGKGSFYVAANDDDELTEGNAVIGAYDGSGTLLWSWHFWVTNYTPQVIDGTLIMDRNLGALNNSNDTQDDILASYGLYYQWGRKDPFIGPSTYNAANNANATMYNSTGGRVTLTVEKSTSKTGTIGYAVQHPLSFITGTEETGYDWLFSAHSATLWAGTKSVNDPCPAGWRVASPASFNALTIDPTQWDEATLPRSKYSATLKSGAKENLFFGIGRRAYDNASFQNFYFTDAAPKSVGRALEGLPWLALYWTTGTQADNTSSAFYFHYGATTLEKAHKMRRANAMPVRCVSETD